jgi:hypothetical protein
MKIGNATATASARNFTHGMRAMFKGHAKKCCRAHQPVEIFQKRNAAAIKEKLAEEGYNELNEEKMADDMDNWEDEAESTAVVHKKRTKAERMHVRTHVVGAMWAEASPEERATVEAEVGREKEEIREEELVAERHAAEHPEECTPRQYQE